MQHLPQAATVGGESIRSRAKLQRKLHLRLSLLIQGNHFFNQFIQPYFSAAENGFPGIVAKSVNQGSQGLNLGNDCVCSAVQQLAVPGIQLVTQFHAQPFSGQADGRQWVFDLVREPAGNFRPGCIPLGLVQDGHIVEYDDLAMTCDFSWQGNTG